MYIYVSARRTVHLDARGNVIAIESEGSLAIHCDREAHRRAPIALQLSNDREFHAKVHPQLDRARFDSERVLALTDPHKYYPLGGLDLEIMRYSTQQQFSEPVAYHPVGNDVAVDAGDALSLLGLVVTAVDGAPVETVRYSMRADDVTTPTSSIIHYKSKLFNFYDRCVTRGGDQTDNQ